MRDLSNRFLAWSLAPLAATICSGAVLTFEGPLQPVSPGQPFTVRIVALLEAQDHPADIRVNMAWDGGGVNVSTCVWNTAECTFSDAGVVVGAAPRVFAACTPAVTNGRVIIGELSCMLAVAADMVFSFDTAPTALPYPSSVSVAGNSMLGDPQDPRDGTDQMTVLARQAPGYALRLAPETIQMALACTSVPVRIVLGGNGAAAAYDHVRIALEFDPDVVRCDGVSNVPAWLNATVLIPSKDGAPGTEQTGSLLIDGRCAPTTFTGEIAVVHFTPLVMEESDLAFVTGNEDGGTVVERAGVDLLGMPDDDKDGVRDGLLAVTPPLGVRFSLEGMPPVVPVGASMRARLLLRADAPVPLDDVQACIMYNTEMITIDEFIPDANLPLEAEISIDPGEYSEGDGGNPEDFHDTNSMLQVWILCHDSTITAGVLELGTVEFSASVEGTLGFWINGDESHAMIEGDDVLDRAVQPAGWPVTPVAVDDGNAGGTLRMGLTAPAAAAVWPGSSLDVTIHSAGRGVTNGAGMVAWAYDPALAAFVGAASPLHVTSVLVAAEAGTTAVLSASGAFTAGTGDTAWGTVRFDLLSTGAVSFVPLFRPAGEFYNGILEGGEDVLGAPDTSRDGVAALTVCAVKPPPPWFTLETPDTLVAGCETRALLHIRNNGPALWDTASAEIWFDAADFAIETSAWRVVHDVPATVELNEIDTVIEATAGGTTTWHRAVLSLRAAAPAAWGGSVADLPVTPLSDMPVWRFVSAGAPLARTGTLFAARGTTLHAPLDDEPYVEEDWEAVPAGLRMWIDDGGVMPAIGRPHSAVVRIDNPNGARVDGVTFSWSGDAQIAEIAAASALPGVDGTVSFSNDDDGYAWLFGDVRLAAPSTAGSIALASCTVTPKVNGAIEFEPESLDLGGAELEPAVWRDDINLLDAAGASWDEACATWTRPTAWSPVPQLVFDDLELDRNEIYVLDLLCEGEGLVNPQPGVFYEWWAEGAVHISIAFNSQAGTARVSPEYNWTGVETIRIYCRVVGTAYLASALLRVIVGEGGAITVTGDRSDYLTATGWTFTDAAFSVAPTAAAVRVTARVQYPNRIWHTVSVRDEATGATSTNQLVTARGRVVWETPASPGTYFGRITAETVPDRSNAPVYRAEETFLVEVVTPYTDTDGDKFLVLYNRAPLSLTEPRKVIITHGSDSDTLNVRVFRAPDSDGAVALDTIISDHGFRAVSLRGSVNVISLGGPLGRLGIHGGVLGSLDVSRGGIGSVRIDTKWLGDWEDFLEVGVRHGIRAQGGIGAIHVTGGDIGMDGEPAAIESRTGSIGSIVARMARRVVGVGEDAYACTMGGNVCATVEAPNGSIGSIHAIGGSIGLPQYDVPCVIAAHGAIANVIAVAKEGDYEALGGYIFSDIIAGGAVGVVKAVGGDISGSDDPEELATAPVLIKGASLRRTMARGKVFRYLDDAEYYGGNIGANAVVSGAITLVSAKGGDMSVSLASHGGIGSVTVKSKTYKLYRDEPSETSGGAIFSSTILPNVLYRSTLPSDYRGVLRKLNVAGSVRDTWIGTRGPTTARQFKFGSLTNSEIWVDGRRMY